MVLYTKNEKTNDSLDNTHLPQSSMVVSEESENAFTENLKIKKFKKYNPFSNKRFK